MKTAQSFLDMLRHAMIAMGFSDSDVIFRLQEGWRPLTAALGRRSHLSKDIAS